MGKVQRLFRRRLGIAIEVGLQIVVGENPLNRSARLSTELLGRDDDIV